MIRYIYATDMYHGSAILLTDYEVQDFGSNELLNLFVYDNLKKKHFMK